MAPPQTLYNTLKVAQDAPAEVVRAAYRVLAQKYHPDRNPGNHAAAAEMVAVNEAYRILSDANLRQQYDLWLISQPASNDSTEVHPTQGAFGERRSYHEATPHNAHSGQVRSKGSVDLEQVWEGWFGSSGATGPASSSHQKPQKPERGSQGSDSVELNTVSDGFAALFRGRRKK